MLYFILGTAISADSFVDVGSCEGAMKIIRELKEDLPLSKLKDDKKLKTRLDDAEQIILRDMEAFKNVKHDRKKREAGFAPRFFTVDLDAGGPIGVTSASSFCVPSTLPIH